MITLCLCGCGQEVNLGRKYIWGHQNMGRKHSKEVLQRRSQTLKINREIKQGIRPPPESVLCACGCGQLCKIGNIYINGHNNRGLTKENNDGVRSMSEKMKNRTKQNSEGRRQQAKKIKNKVPTQAMIVGYQKISKKLTNKTPTLAMLDGWKRVGEKLSGRTKETHEYISKRAKKMTGRTKETHPGVHRIAESHRLLWQDPEFAEMMMKKLVKGRNQKPNIPEKLIYNLLQQILPNEYHLNVKGDIIIAGKIPDFININGQKKLIEFNGDYWHNEEETQERITLFKKYGWDCLVIWEHELEDINNVVNKILQFHDLPLLSCTKQVKLEECLVGGDKN